ncbi:MAG: TraB/GumN family protein [Flavobacteriales bacterium]|nr:TraB/GumN family protein [Flavobacteriales bacterium]
MNRFFSGLAASLIVIGSSIGSFAQETNSLLWKVSGKDMNKPSYLFGTIHMLPQDKYFFTEKMQEAFNSSDVLALEAELEVPLAEQMKMASQMIMPEGKSWADYMTADEYALVKSAFVDSLGIKEKKVDKYSKIRPIYISGLIMNELLGKVKMYEQELTSIAKKDSKEIIGLETIQEQMEIVSNIPIEDQIDDLKSTTASMMRDYNEMLDAYIAQDLKALEATSQESESFDKMEAKLLTERNDRWTKAIQEKLGDKSYFFAVGAMHLVGESGLINQLQKAGYSVEAVK